MSGQDYFYNKPDSQTRDEFMAERQEAVQGVIDCIAKTCGVSYVDQRICVRLPAKPGKAWGHSVVLVVAEIETDTQINERVSNDIAQTNRQDKLDALVDKALKGDKTFHGMQAERYYVEYGEYPK